MVKTVAASDKSASYLKNFSPQRLAQPSNVYRMSAGDESQGLRVLQFSNPFVAEAGVPTSPSSGCSSSSQPEPGCLAETSAA
eukprot:3788829-Amphidinium_carterae.1